MKIPEKPQTPRRRAIWILIFLVIGALVISLTFVLRDTTEKAQSDKQSAQAAKSTAQQNATSAAAQAGAGQDFATKFLEQCDKGTVQKNLAYLCPQAEAVASAQPIVSTNNVPPRRTVAEVQAIVIDVLKNYEGPIGADGATGKPGPSGAPGPPGEDGSNAPPPTLAQVVTSVIIALQENPNLVQPQIVETVTLYLQANPPAAGKDGLPGAPGPKGEPGLNATPEQITTAVNAYLIENPPPLCPQESTLVNKNVVTIDNPDTLPLVYTYVNAWLCVIN